MLFSTRKSRISIGAQKAQQENVEETEALIAGQTLEVEEKSSDFMVFRVNVN
jgi:hypothetical protein